MHINILEALKRSKLTQKKQKEERIIKYNLNPTKCLFCGRKQEYSHRMYKFCNRSCAAKFNNKNKRIYKKCEFCENILKSNRYKYCSHKCQQNNQWLLLKATVESTGKFDIGRSGCTHLLRRYLIEARGYKCEICNLSEWMNKPICLDVDHIDGDSGNNYITNLRLLCKNCHAQTPTYGGKNKGKGRYYRRQRYKEGKSS